jgi:hypothetical protein
MVRTHTPSTAHISGPDQRCGIGTHHGIFTAIRPKMRVSPFWLHYLEMFAAMMIGTMLPSSFASGRFLAVINRGGGKAAVAGLGAAVLLAAGGCAGHTAAPAPAPARSTAASTPAPTATPLTAAELAWIAGVTSLHHKVDKPFRASSMTMTRAKMTELGHALRTCGRELRRMGAPGTRLQPVYVKVTRACRALGKGARCFAKAASRVPRAFRTGIQ